MSVKVTERRTVLRVIALTLAVLLVLQSLLIINQPSARAGGGIEIDSCEDLRNIDNDLYENYTLTSDISCAFDEIFYDEDFEDGAAGWTSSGKNDSWHLASDTCQSNGALSSPYDLGTTAYGTNGAAGIDCNYPGDGHEESCDLLNEEDPGSHDCVENSRLLSPVISLPENDNLYLQFYSWAYDEGGECVDSGDYDAKDIGITTDGGDNITLLNDCTKLHDYSDNDEEPDFRVQWFPVSDFAGQDIQLAFDYNTDDTCCDFELGWFVDNIKIGEASDPYAPLADGEQPFSGILDGNGYALEFILIEDDGDSTGLFGAMENATVQNLRILGGFVGGLQRVGALAGTATSSTISNVHSWATVTAVDEGEAARVGGLVGTAVGAGEQAMLIEKSSFRGTVEGDYEVGGIVGEAEAAEGSVIIRQSWSTGNINGNETNAGGLVGRVNAFTETENRDTMVLIEDTYTNTDTVGYENVGGLVGLVEAYNDGVDNSEASAIIRRSYTVGEIDGDNNVGGLIATALPMNNAGESIQLVNSFTAADTDSIEETEGALMGTVNEGEVPVVFTNNFYDSDENTAPCSYDIVEFEGCTPIEDSDYFRGNSSNEPLDTWNFSSIWYTRPHYPVLTAHTYANTDNDNISDAVEKAGPNNGDANGDNIPDSEQDNVASFVNPVTGKYVALETTDDCEIVEVFAQDESDNAVKDSGFNYLNGFMNFTLECDGDEGFVATISQYYFDVTSPGSHVLRKYIPETNAYFTISEASFTAGQFLGKSTLIVTYEVEDNGILDLDSEDGIIVDPVGVAALSASINAPNTGLGKR